MLRVRSDVTQRSVAFRVDADAAIGIGHLRRCLTLARELQQEGLFPHFICRPPLGPRFELNVNPFALHWLNRISRGADPRNDLSDELRDADATLAIIRDMPVAPSWIVLDSYRYACAWESKMRKAGHQILVIEDFRDREHYADLLVSDSEMPFDPALNRAKSGRVLIGRAYALLDAEYAYIGSSQATERKRLIISYGGADPTKETQKALQAIRKLKSDPQVRNQVGRVDVVVGLVNPDASAIRRAADHIPEVFVHQSLCSLAPLARQADLILTSGGNTMIEALALRKPCIVTVTGKNQKLMVNELVSEGVIRSLGEEGTVNPLDLLTMIKRVLKDFEPFVARIASKSLFDHLGARRIVSAMLEASVQLSRDRTLDEASGESG